MKRFGITYFTKYLVEYLSDNELTINELLDAIMDKRTGNSMLDLYSNISKDFIRKVVEYLLRSKRLVEVGGYLYATDYVRKELREGKTIYYEEVMDDIWELFGLR